MRTWEERGPYGRWLVTARLARGYKTTAPARAALASAGIAIAESVYAQYESGTKKPSRKHMPLLEDHWGPFSDPLGTTETPDALVAALRDQTAAIEALVARLDTFVGPLGEVVADMLRDRVRAATDRTRSGAPTS